MPASVAFRPLTVVACAIAIVLSSNVVGAQDVDAGYNPGANQVVWSMAVQPDGKVLVGGGFTGLGGGTGTTTRNHIGRLNTDGTVDSTFNPGANSIVQAIAVQPDGKILIAGNFTSVGGGTGLTTIRNRIARLNADGSVDSTFDPGANNNIYALAVQADGKILVGGAFNMLGGGGTGTTARIGLGRLNADGSLDTFNPGTSKTIGAPAVYSLALQTDGKIVVGGYFNGLGGGTGATVRNWIGRLNSDGSVDGPFNPGATFYVDALALQADGKILVGGDFIGLGGGDGSGSSRSNIGRLNADGSVDVAFNPGTESQVNSLAVQVDGKILAAGYFKWMGAAGGAGKSTRNYIGRMNVDGTVDGTFNPGADNILNAVAIQGDGAIVAGGSFAHVGGGTGLTTARSGIARFPTTAAAVQTLTLTSNGTIETWMRSGAGPEVTRVTFEFSFGGGFYTMLGNGTRVPGGWQLTTGPNLPASHALYLRARGYYGSGFQNGSGSIVESISFHPGAHGSGDFDGDGSSDVTVYRPSTGAWYVLKSGSNYTTYTAYQWGLNTDVPVVADYDGDGISDIAIFRPSTGTFWVLFSGANFTTYASYSWGVSTDVPVVGDYDGDGKADIAIYRPSTGAWWILFSATGTYANHQWGISGDVPLPADYDGDGKTDIAVFRPSSGTWFTLFSATNFTTFSAQSWGVSTDVPVPADYDGDGKSDIAVFRPSSGTWYILQSHDSSFAATSWGISTDVPVPGDYDADGKADVAVFRPSSGTWYVLKSTSGVGIYNWGSATDVPILRRP